MQLAFTTPCRHRSAHPSQSRTAVWRPGTAVLRRAVTRLTLSTPSQMVKTGFPYTPVLSRATGVLPARLSQSTTHRTSSVLGEQVWLCGFPRVLSQAPTVLACPASPPPPSSPTALATSLRPRRERTGPDQASALRTHPTGANTVGCRQAVLGSGYLPGCRPHGDSTSAAPETSASVALGCLLFILRGDV